MTRHIPQTDVVERIQSLLSAFRLPTVREELVARLRQDGHEDALETIASVFELEAAARKERRVARLRNASKLPPGKTFDTLQLDRFGRKLQTHLRDLARGRFIRDCINVLAFGLPGVGKSHAACAIGHTLVNAGISVYFTPAYKLVQELRAAKEALTLPRLLHRLDRFDALILDDLGYVQQAPEDAEVLFTLLAERYERRSLIITSNLVFSDWGRIFGNPMATAAAIDRVVHHSVILEFDVPSYRSDAANYRQSNKGVDKKNEAENEAKDTQNTQDKESKDNGAQSNHHTQNTPNTENGSQDNENAENNEDTQNRQEHAQSNDTTLSEQSNELSSHDTLNQENHPQHNENTLNRENAGQSNEHTLNPRTEAKRNKRRIKRSRQRKETKHESQ